MPPITLFEIGAGLGVGAFFGALYYAIARLFRFKTRVIGSRSATLIATLIVLIAGSSTLAALILYAPSRDLSNRSGQHQLDRKEQLDALALYAEATNTLQSKLFECRSRYAHLHAQFAHSGMPAEQISTCISEQVYEDIMKAINLWAMNSKLKAAFPTFRYQGMDWDAVRENGKQQYTRVFDAMNSAVLAAKNPATDQDVLRAIDNYISFRKKVADAANATLLP